MGILRNLFVRRDELKALRAYVRTLEQTIEETTPKGPHLYHPRPDGFTYVYQCVGRIPTSSSHWSDGMNTMH